MRIPFVKDDPAVSSFVIRGPHKAGYTVDQAGCGEEACSLALAATDKARIFNLMLPNAGELTLMKYLCSLLEQILDCPSNFQANRTDVPLCPLRQKIEKEHEGMLVYMSRDVSYVLRDC